jgi:two-component system, LuxR family, response regulator FixJ
MSRILLIDDDASVRRTVTRMLKAAGYAVQTATSGEEGLELARDGSFDAILSDIHMPGLSGLDTLRRLREMRVGTPFVMMTGFGTIEIAVEAMKLGAVDFVQKPFFRDELLSRVRDAVERPPAGDPSAVPAAPPEGSVAAARARAEREMIVAALARHDGEISAAARDMQISRTTMWRLMKKHGL